MDELEVFLELDGLYLFAARQHVSRATPPKSRIRRLTQRLIRLHDALPIHRWNEDDEGEEEPGVDSSDIHDRLVTIGNNIEDTYFQLVRAFRPSWQHCAEAIILSTLSVEAHMNRRIIELVSSSKERDKLTWAGPPHEKMQKVLRYLGKKAFSTSDKTFCDYQHVVRYRNNLAHYKPKLMLYDDGRPPRLPENLGLIPREAKKAVRIGEDLIEAFSQRLGVSPPAWVRRNVDHFFEFA
jgi:hypothetical protein